MRAANILLIGLSLALASVVAAAVAAPDNRALLSGEALTSNGTVTVRGRISVVGTRQKIKPLPVFKSRVFCGTTVRNETLLISAAGGLQNAVVIFHPLDKKLPAQTKALILDNKHCAFVPHVQVAPVGSELLLKNSDPILHTVHARLGKETLFNVGLPKWRQVNKRLDRTGIIRIDCDVLHTWMSAAIVVTDTPYYAISDERGSFAFGGLPVGSYDMEIWHEKLGTLRQRIPIDKASSSELDIIYSLDQSR
ncbi:MAG TPA: carboxypeptidase regulatory-like domain-containing protein [Candidatus Binatia bacterium]|nr:carboxypeptidase regulatory-like domain-containing protein [Candidatus Binatia bacterium]